VQQFVLRWLWIRDCNGSSSWTLLIADGNTELQESSFKGNDTVLIFLTGQDFHLKYGVHIYMYIR
jgi:hypothetical protein